MGRRSAAAEEGLVRDPLPFGDEIEVIDLSMPDWYMALSGKVRGYWKREIAVLLAAVVVGLLVGRVLP